jgi:regulator of RNase E activity RraA
VAADTQADAERSERFRGIYTGAIADVLYELGHGAQTLPHAIKPIVKGHRIAAPAFTVEWVPYVGGDGDPHGERAWDMLAAVPPGYVAVAATHIVERAVLGDLAMAYLRARGCAGVIVDGGCRDIQFNEEIGLPTFCAFMTPQDASHGRGTVKAWGHEIGIGEVRIRADDFVVADADGVIVIPHDLVDEVLQRAEALVGQETQIREALLAGASPQDLFGGTASPAE